MIEGYIRALQEVQEADIEEFVHRINKDGRVFIMGNGGSASTSNHLASDLQAIGLGAVSLCANTAILTRSVNDFGDMFGQQLKEQHMAAGETVIAISASGSSENILSAVLDANRMGAVTLALIGFRGGSLRNLVDYSITISSCDYGEVEGVHSCLCHIIPRLLQEGK